jgi:hypothetical protein
MRDSGHERPRLFSWRRHGRPLHSNPVVVDQPPLPRRVEAEVSSIWSDDPIDSKRADVLDRRRFAKLVASRINSTPTGSASTVFGLVGAWGSGKSSLINMVRECLDGDWGVAVFAPWATGESGTLTLAFLKALETALGEDQSSAAARAAVFDYLAWGVPLLNLIPVAGGAAAGLGDEAVKRLQRRPSWEVQFEETALKLLEAGKRVLIVADDIDRLDGGELLEFLKVVRLLGRFPNVHYVVAYDQATVEELLESQGIGGRASSYMEKIVQHPFEIPPIDEAIRASLVTESLELVMASVSTIVEIGFDGRKAELARILARGMLTPRSHFRFRHQLDSYAQIVSFREIDFLDFAALTYLRIYYHDLFEALPSWVSQLRLDRTGGRATDGGSSASLDELWPERIRATLRDGQRAEVPLQIMSFLFSSVTVDGFSFHAGHSRALSDGNYFDRYYNLGIPRRDVSDDVVISAIRGILNGERTPLPAEEGRPGLEAGDNHSTVSTDPREQSSGADQQAIIAFEEAITDRTSSRGRLAAEKGRQLRRTSGTASMYLIEFLNAVSRMDIFDVDEDSHSGVIRSWLARELFLGYRDGIVDRKYMTRNYYIQGALELLVVIFSTTSDEGGSMARMRQDFAEYFVGKLETDLEAFFHGNLLRQTLDVIGQADRWPSLTRIFDAAAQRDPQIFDDVTFEMVSASQVSGEDKVETEYSFDTKLWTRLFSRRVRELLTPTLGLRPKSDEQVMLESHFGISTDDRWERLRRFAIDAAQAAQNLDADEMMTRPATLTPDA